MIINKYDHYDNVKDQLLNKVALEITMIIISYDRLPPKDLLVQLYHDNKIMTQLLIIKMERRYHSNFADGMISLYNNPRSYLVAHRDWEYCM